MSHSAWAVRRIIQGGSDKSGILIWFFLNDKTHLKTIRFCSSKNWLAEERNENKFFLFNEIAVRSYDNLNPGPEPLAGLRHGAPGEEPHYLPDLSDQVTGFFGGFALTLNSGTPPEK